MGVPLEIEGIIQVAGQDGQGIGGSDGFSTEILMPGDSRIIIADIKDIRN